MNEPIDVWLSKHENSLHEAWSKLSGQSLQTVQESLILVLTKNLDSTSIVPAVESLLGFVPSKDETIIMFRFRLAYQLLNKLLTIQTETSVRLIDKIITKLIEVLCNEDFYTPAIQKLVCEYLIHYSFQFKNISWLSNDSKDLYTKIKTSILSILTNSTSGNLNFNFTFESAVYLSVEILQNYKNEDNNIQNQLFSLALNKITIGEHNERRLIVAVLLPLLLDPTVSSHLQELWESIQKLYAMEDLYRKDSYDILCRFIDKYLNQDKITVDLRCQTTFWNMVQQGFLDGDGIIMKRSSFLLKKCILVTSNNKSMESPTKYFKWDSTNTIKLRKSWDIFFLIFETLEEFNLHLIQPIWSQFKILDKEEYIDESWINILYQKAFANENPTVRKWTIITVLDSVDDIHYNKEFVLGPLYNGLIDNLIYKGMLAPRIIEAIIKFLYVFTLSIKDKDSQILWIQEFINKIEQTPVIPSVAITSLLSFLGKLNPLPFVNSSTIASLCSLIIAKTYLFHGTWKVKFYTLVTNILSMHSDYQNLQFEDIVKYLKCLNSIGIDSSTDQSQYSDIFLFLKKWLSRFNRDWYYSQLSLFIKYYYQEPSIKEVITSYELKKYIQDSKLIAFIIMLSDNTENCVLLLRPLFEILSQVYARSYICEGYTEKLLSLLTSLLLSKNNSEYLTILKGDINSVFDNIISYIDLKTSTFFKGIQKFKREDAVWYYQCNIIYMSWLDSAFSSLYEDYFVKLNNMYTILLDSSLHYLFTILPTKEISEDSEYIKVSAMYTLFILSKWITIRKGTDSLGIVLNRLLDVTNVKSNKPELCSYGLDPIQKDIWKYCGISFYDYKWKYLYNIITYATKSQSFIMDDNVIGTMVDIVTEELDVATIEYMSTIVDTLRLLMVPYLSKLDTLNSETVSKISRTFKVGWSSVLEKKSIVIVSSLVSLIFQPVVLRKSITNSEGVALIKKYFNLILEKGQSMPVIVNILSFHLCQFLKLEQSSNAIDIFRNELACLCIFGPDRPGTRKQEDFDSDIIIPSYSSISEFSSIAIPVSDLFVRVNIINLLQSIFPNDTCNIALSNLLLELLSKQLKIAPKKQYRYFSEEHKSHIRLWQIICTFVPYIHKIDPTLIQSINNTYWDTVMLQNHKSVRYFIEIFGSVWLYAFPIFTDSFIKTLSDLNSRADVIQSALIIGNYLLVSTDFTIPQTQEIIKSILMWLTTHHLHIRRIAQVILVKLVDTLKSRQSPLLQQEPSLLVFYDFIHNNSESAKYLTQQNILLQLINDPVKEFSLELVLYKLFQEEGFPQGETINTKELCQFIGLQESNFVAQMNVATENIDSNTSTPTENKVMSNEDFQKKITPWATLEYEETMYREDLLTSKSRQNIIVCASLIDRVPNMAGLSRTCEIFNAKALILPNKKIVDHPQFQEISVTAEKWLPIIEVTESDLQQYLLEKKQEGWSIVGLEQTANSKTLVNYNFPEKTLLLLGKEKEGIPVEYLQLVDQCIEIPQLGLIRSLNVHVAGSLFIWEYTKQQLLKQK